MRRAALAALSATLSLALAGCSVVGAPAPTTEQAPGQAAERFDVTGDVRVHDPGLVVGDATHPWFVFSTGDLRVGLGAIQVRTSTDGHTWSYAGEAWLPQEEPAWAVEKITGVENFWAPEVLRVEDTWYLYYAASTFGSNTSAIGLRTASALNPDLPSAGWTDRGEVISSDGTKDYNAIDPAVLIDAEGNAWLAFGSFWQGIFMVPLDLPSGKPKKGATPVQIASRGTATNAIEAPAFTLHDGWYYLFVSFDSCCQGSDSTYNINVGRSRTPQGPYLDAKGVPLTEGGGTLLLGTEGAMIGPGGQSVSGDFMAYHYYDGDAGGEPTLALTRIGWTDDGWPVLATPPQATAKETP